MKEEIDGIIFVLSLRDVLFPPLYDRVLNVAGIQSIRILLQVPSTQVI